MTSNRNRFMKIIYTPTLLLSGMLLLVLGSCKQHSRTEKSGVLLSIIPQPNEIHVYDGFFILDSTTQIVFSTAEQERVVVWFNKELQKTYRMNCRIGEALEEKNSIILLQNDSLGHEAYLLDINDSEISISASSESGYFYAFQTILQ